MKDTTINEVAKALPVVLKQGGYFAFANNGYDPKRAPDRVPCLYVHAEQPVTKELLKLKEPALGLASYACGVVRVQDGQITFRMVKPSSKSITLDQLKTQLKQFQGLAKQHKKLGTLLRGKLPAFLNQPRCEETDRYLLAESVDLEQGDDSFDEMTFKQVRAGLAERDRQDLDRLRQDFQDIATLLKDWRARYGEGIDVDSLEQASQDLAVIELGVKTFAGHDDPEANDAWHTSHRKQLATLEKRLGVARRHLDRIRQVLQTGADLPDLIERAEALTGKTNPATGQAWRHAERLAELDAVEPRLKVLHEFGLDEGGRLARLLPQLMGLRKMTETLLRDELEIDRHEAAALALLAGEDPATGHAIEDVPLLEALTEELTWFEARAGKIPGSRGRGLSALTPRLRTLEQQVRARVEDAAAEAVAADMLATATSLGELRDLGNITPTVAALRQILTPLPARMKAQVKAIRQPHLDAETRSNAVTQGVSLAQYVYSCMARFGAMGDDRDRQDAARQALAADKPTQELLGSTCAALGALLEALLDQGLDAQQRDAVVGGGLATIELLNTRFAQGARANGGDWLGTLGRVDTALSKLRRSYIAALGRETATELLESVTGALAGTRPGKLPDVEVPTDDLEKQAIVAEMSRLVLAELEALQPAAVHGLGKKKKEEKLQAHRQREWLRKLVEGEVQSSMPNGGELSELRRTMLSMGQLLARVRKVLAQHHEDEDAIPGAADKLVDSCVEGLAGLKAKALRTPAWRSQARLVVEATARDDGDLTVLALAKVLVREGLITPVELATWTKDAKAGRLATTQAQQNAALVGRSKAWQDTNRAAGEVALADHERDHQETLALVQKTIQAFLDPLLQPGGWRKVPLPVRRLCLASVEDLEAAGVVGSKRFTVVRDQIFLRWLNPQLVGLRARLEEPGQGRVAQDASRLVLNIALGTPVKTAKLLPLQRTVTRYQGRVEAFLDELVEGTRRELRPAS